MLRVDISVVRQLANFALCLPIKPRLERRRSPAPGMRCGPRFNDFTAADSEERYQGFGARTAFTPGVGEQPAPLLDV